MTTTVKYLLTLLEEGQLNSHIVINQVAEIIDAIIYRAAVTQTNSPPAHVYGSIWIVGTSPIGAWAGKANNLVLSLNAAWIFFPPLEGMFIHNKSDDTFYLYNGTAWVPLVMTSTLAADVGALGTQVGGVDSAPNTVVITDPADAPATADILRDDLVANALPEIRNNLRTLLEKCNLIRTNLRTAGLMS